MNYLKAVLLFFITFAVYVFTLHPGIPAYRDSGDLAAAASTLGVAHPPGYPLYILSGKIFSDTIIFGNTAYRMNVMSAFYGALTVLILSLISDVLFSGSLAAGMSVLILAFTTSFWRLAQVPEMYSMNAFFAVLMILIVLLSAKNIKENPQQGNGHIYLISFIGGISLGCHQTIVLLFPGIVYLLAANKTLNIKNIVSSILFFVLGFSVYLYLPLRASSGPVVNWGDLSNVNGFLRMITRSDYGGAKLHPEQSNFEWSAGLIINHAILYLKSLSAQFSLAGLVLGLAGMFVTIKDKYFRFVLISFLLSGFGFVVLSNLPVSEKTTLPILEPHFVLPNLLFLLFISAVFAVYFKNIFGRILLLSVIALVFFKHYPLCDYRNQYFSYDYGKNLLRTMPKNSIFYNPDDSTMFIINYMQVVQKARPDIKLAAYYRTRWGYKLLKQKYPEILPNREITSGRELETVLLDENRNKFPIFSEFPFKFPQGYNSFPYGLASRLSADGRLGPVDSSFDTYSLRNKMKIDEKTDFFTGRIMSYYSSAHSNMGLAFYQNNLFEKARENYFMALSIDPGLEAANNNLGTLEYSQKNYDRALVLFSSILKTNPGSALARYNAGLVYRAKKEYPAAVENFKTAWETGGSISAANDLGLLYLETGKVTDAKELFESVIKKEPSYLLPYYNLALVCERMKDYESSRKYYTFYLNNVRDPAEKNEVGKILKNLPK